MQPLSIIEYLNVVEQGGFLLKWQRWTHSVLRELKVRDMLAENFDFQHDYESYDLGRSFFGS